MKSVAINVGANSDTPGGRGPISSDGSFQYVPIKETDTSVPEPTYRDLGLRDVRPEKSQDTVTHFDPEFPEFDYGKNYTYGDRHSPKTTEITKLCKGDIIFFYVTLDYVDDADPKYEWINEGWGAYIIGHFTLDRDPIAKEDYDALPSAVQEQLATNAHFRRENFDAEVLILGAQETSSLYDKPIPLSADEGSEANRVVTSLSEDSGAGPWFRRPLPFDEGETKKILSARETGNYDTLLNTREFLDFPKAKSFARFVSLRSDWYQLWELFDNSNATREQRLLGSFVYIAGGNNQEAVELVLNEVQTLEGAVQNRELVQAELNDLYMTEDLDNSNHRKYLGGYTDAEGKGGDVMEALESFYENLEPSFEEFLEAIQTEDEDPFDVGLARLRWGVDSYCRLSAFDQLELWQQLLELDWLAPSTLRKSYVCTAGPKRGFKLVFGIAMDELSDEEVNAKLQLLHDYAINELQMNPARAVYDLESALCNFQKGDAELDDDPARDASEPC